MNLKMKMMFRVVLGIFLTFLISFNCLVWGDESQRTVFQAMQDELDRSMQELKMAGSPAPYFLSYKIEDFDMLSINYRYGGLIYNQQYNARYLNIDLRVGSMDLDNSGFFPGGQNPNEQISIPQENAYRPLRFTLWYWTDKFYKEAIELLAGKRSYLKSHPDPEPLADFSPVKPFVWVEPEVKRKSNSLAWQERLKGMNKAFSGIAGLEDWMMRYYEITYHQWYVNSQKSRNFVGGNFYQLLFSAVVQAEDGQRLIGFVSRLSPHEPQKEDDPGLIKEVHNMAKELKAVIQSPRVDEYQGPVLFVGQAAAQFYSQVFINELSPVRKPLSDQGAGFLAVGRLVGKLKKRILPSSVTIIDQPSWKVWQGHPLVGYMPVDDEGVEPQALTLVENGKLVNLPMNRQPGRKIHFSNGHAISSLSAGVSNLLISSANPLSFDNLILALRQHCKEQDLKYGIMITLLSSPRIDQEDLWVRALEPGNAKSLLTAPVLAYKVYASDGHIEPLRGLEFEDISVNILKDILALGSDTAVYNIIQTTYIPGQKYLASVITPSVLVEEMEMHRITNEVSKPYGKNPITP